MKKKLCFDCVTSSSPLHEESKIVYQQSEGSEKSPHSHLSQKRPFVCGSSSVSLLPLCIWLLMSPFIPAETPFQIAASRLRSDKQLLSRWLQSPPVLLC